MKKSHVPESTVQDVIVWINAHIHEALPLDKIAHRVGYSKWHFQRLFHHYTGVALADFIRKKKLYLTVRDLKYRREPIINIALDYGFNSHQSFTRTFRNHFNCTPSLCRSRNAIELAPFHGAEICKACMQRYGDIDLQPDCRAMG